ncbi:MAG: Segregation and condensation protein B [Methanonatronarchaeales archaeon]|nr:Segregation and condensation protein B [Methanonatronarchaeales archaeon]
MKRTIEAALFTVGKPVPIDALVAMTDSGMVDVMRAIEELSAEYEGRNSAVEVKEVGEDKFVMQVSPRYAEEVMTLAPRELSAPLLRTLSVIAYQQPVTQSDVVEVRGNTAYSHVDELVEQGLVSAEPHGRTKMLTTTKGFAEYFGLPGKDADEVRRYLEEEVDADTVERFLG